MSEQNEVTLPYRYYPDFTTGRPVANGYIYIGSIDTDPQVSTNQKQVKAIQENGTQVTLSQPIRTSAGGVPQHNGSPVQLIVEGAHSIKVLNSNGAQVYYASNIVSGMRPSTIVRSQVVPSAVSLTNRFINNILFIPNTTMQSYYSIKTPVLDLGNITFLPFNFENIPVSRIDLAQGSSSIDLGVL